MEAEEDRISKLPDCLIHEILSLIGIQSAVQTSVLSKRWKDIWMSLPFISLDYSLFLDGKKHNLNDSVTASRLLDRFIAFVDKVFELHDNSDIQMIKLQLLIDNDDLVETLNRWIRAAVDHNVQHLNINVAFSYSDPAYEIPHQLLNCKSLKSLLIVSVSSGTRVSLILPKSMSVSQLKKLVLAGISISSLELQRILSSCPLLEIILIRGCDIQLENKRNITIDSRSLQMIELMENRHTHLGSEDHSLTCTTTISAPNAMYFGCTSFMTDDFSLESFSSLAHARFETTLRGREEDETAKTYSQLPAEEKEVFARRMMKFLRAVHNVQHLALSSGFLEVLLQAPGSVYRQPFQLGNLKVLILNMRFTRGCLSSIAYLLKISPILTSLKLTSNESNLADVGDDVEAGFSLTCKFSHLKLVEIREMEGCDIELKFLRFLLENSLVLEDLILIFRSTCGALDREKVIRNVRALPTASSCIKMHMS